MSFPTFGAAAAYAAPTRTNIILQSQTLQTTWAVTSATITADTTAAPDGTTTADTLTRTATGASHVHQTLVKAASALQYTFSVFGKVGAGNFLAIECFGSSSANRADACFNLSTGAISLAASVTGAFTAASAAIVQFGLYYRCSLTFTTDTSTGLTVNLSSSSVSQKADATGSANGSTAILWGAQMERGGVATAYIVTVAASASDSSAVNATYPASNLADLYNVRTPTVWAASGGAYFTFTLAAAKAIQFIGLCHHNAPAGASFRILLFSDNNPDPVGNSANQVADSGSQVFPTPVSLYPSVTPYKFANAVSARSGWIELSDRRYIDNLIWQLGGVEVSGWWEWTDVGVDRSLGLKANDSIAAQPFGVDHAMSAFNPRTWAGNRAMTDQSENLTTALDFALEKKTSKPFVFAWDVSDSTTFERECMLVRLASLTPPVQGDYPEGTQTISLVEHLR